MRVQGLKARSLTNYTYFAALTKRQLALALLITGSKKLFYFK